MSVLRFVVPMPPHVTNASGGSRHWRTIYAKKAEYLETLDLLQGVGFDGDMRRAKAGLVEVRIPPAPLLPFQRVRIASTMYLGGAMDDDNALARHKPLLDWLKTRGYLADDRKKNIIWEGLPEQVIKRDGKYRIEFQLTAQ